MLLTACATDRAGDPVIPPGVTAPVWAESSPEVVTDIDIQPPAETPSTPAPPPTKEPETTPPPTPTPTERPETTETPVDDGEFPQSATLLQSATVYDADKTNPHTLSAGANLRVAAKAEDEWLKAWDNGETVWLHLDEPDGIMVETPTGYFFLWVVIDGLDYT